MKFHPFLKYESLPQKMKPLPMILTRASKAKIPEKTISESSRYLTNALLGSLSGFSNDRRILYIKMIKRMTCSNRL